MAKKLKSCRIGMGRTEFEIPEEYAFTQEDNGLDGVDPDSVKNKTELFYKWKGRAFVDKLLDDGETPYKITKWCKDNGFNISHPIITKYAHQRKESLVKGVQVEQLKEINKKPEKENKKVLGKLKSDMDLLDAVLQKGFETLQRMEAVAPKDFLKAIEIKHKITGGNHGGLTKYGLEAIRIREKARENAMITTILRFIPREQHEVVLNELERITREYYEKIGLGEAYEELNEGFLDKKEA